PFIPLLETAAGVALVAEILAGPRPAEVYFGLNDLSLDLGRDFMFEPLAEGMLDAPAALLCAAGVPFGLGGVARVGTGAVPAELVLGEHVRLGSDRVILSRGFHDRAATVAEMRQNLDFRGELSALKAAYAAHTRADPGHLAQNRAAFQAAVAAVAAKMR
ncbi:MAG: aldolase, partial [Pseudomonadota bacterium]